MPKTLGTPTWVFRAIVGEASDLIEDGLDLQIVVALDAAEIGGQTTLKVLSTWGTEIATRELRKRYGI